MLQETLRQETKIEHRAIEKAINFQEITASGTSYLSLLKKLYGFYSPIERNLLIMKDSLEKVGISLTPRLKKSLLEEDLFLMGLSSLEVNNLPLCSKLPNMNSVEKCLGVLYVLEGSTLGGQIIYRNLIEKNDFAQCKSFKFHLAYGEKTTKMWQEFKSALNANPEQKHSEIVLSANHTFQALRNWIQND